MQSLSCIWDSVANVVNTEQKLPYFDKVLSFDPVDCKKFERFAYRPLFFLDKYCDAKPSRSSNRLFFVGTLNGDRPKIISSLALLLSGVIVFDYWLFVRSRVELFFRQIFERELRNLDHSRLIFAPMSSKEISDRYEECSAVLDIEHPKQTGLTMRTFEVIASGRKLVTTNINILSQDFYEPDRIAVIKRGEPSLPDGFLLKNPPPVTEIFKRKYSLKGWLSEIFEGL
jgi:hypothetical protein